jgi:hypothetical protein
VYSSTKRTEGKYPYTAVCALQSDKFNIFIFISSNTLTNLLDVSTFSNVSYIFSLTVVSRNKVDTSNKFVRVFDEIKMKILNLSDWSAHTAVYGYLPSVRFVTILREKKQYKSYKLFSFYIF